MTKIHYDNEFIAYDQLNSKTNHDTTIIFLGGFRSDMAGTKAIALHHYCQTKGYGLIRFDYFGHGSSSGNFLDGTIGLWKQNVLTVMKQLAPKQVVLVGSSMGGWLMLLAALERRDQVRGLIGIAAAPDFTENLIWQPMQEQDKQVLLTNKVIKLPPYYGDCNYEISLNLIEEARQHLLLTGQININCPVRLLHGMQDHDVPYHTSIQLTKSLTSSDVRLTLVKDADHRMAREEDLRLLYSSIEELAGRA